MSQNNIIVEKIGKVKVEESKIKRKLKILPIKEKIEIIKKIDEGVKRSVISREYGIPMSTITCIYKKKLIICNHNNSNTKRIRKCKNEQLNEAVLTFVRQAQSVKLPLSGNLLREKAKLFASKLSLLDFSASEGWLHRFKKRHNISFKRLRHENSGTNDVDAETKAMSDDDIIENIALDNVEVTYENDDDSDENGKDDSDKDDSNILETPTDQEVDDSLKTLFYKLVTIKHISKDVWDAYYKLVKTVNK